MSDSVIWEKNLKALESMDPDLAQRLRGMAPEELVSAIVEKSRVGKPTLKFMRHDGATVYLHSRFDPEREARERIAGLEPGPGMIPVFMGAGLGYLPLALVAGVDKDRMIVILEPSAAVFHRALETLDWTPLLERKHIVVIVGADPKAVDERLASEIPVVDIIEPRIIPAVNDPGRLWDSGTAQALTQAVLSAFETGRLQYRTLRKMGEWFLFNILKNLPWILNSPGIRNLENAFKGGPAALVAAGPSAAAGFPALARNRDKLLIIAVDTAVGPLLRAGIKPHGVVTVDPQPANMLKFEFLPPLDVPLIFSMESVPGAVSGWAGPRICFGRPGPVPDYFRPLEQKGILRGFGTVSSDALALAVLMGADPLALVGFDLGFPGGARYVPGTWAENANPPRLAGDVEVESVNGNPLPTWKVFRDQIKTMGAEILKTRARVINTSTVGARIPGTVPGAIEDVLSDSRQFDVGADPRVRSGPTRGCAPTSTGAIDQALSPGLSAEDRDIRSEMLKLLKTEIDSLKNMEQRAGELLRGMRKGPPPSGLQSDLNRFSSDINDKKYLSDALVARFAERKNATLESNLDEMKKLLQEVQSALDAALEQV